MKCPRCSTALDSNQLQLGTAWTCRDCQGVLLARSVLDAQAGRGSTTSLWSRAEAAAESLELDCPECRGGFRQWREPAGGDWIELDACLCCGLLWFDRGEIHKLNDSLSERRASSRASATSGGPLVPGWVGEGVLDVLASVLEALWES